jgi:hypothetical protein
MIGVVAFVGDRSVCDEAFDQIMRKSNVVALSRRTDQAQRIAKRVTGGMDFGAQAAAGAAKTLGIRAPLSLRAPAAC